MHLTKAQRDTLIACADWSADYEVALRRPGIIDLDGQRSILGRLRNSGLVEYGQPNSTWRITEAGRTALKEQGR